LHWERDLIYLGVLDKALSMARDLDPHAASRYVHDSIRLLCKSYHPDANPHRSEAAVEGMLRLNRIRERFDQAGEESLARFLASRVGPAGGGRARILLVEPDDQARAQIGQWLTEEGFTVRSAANGVQGMLEHFAFRPTLVLSELELPLMNGLSMVEELRGGDRDLCVVMMSHGGQNVSGGRILREQMEARGYSYLEKPFRPSQLFRLLRNCLAV
jgi:two-component system chemotaxis response regulator CheY